MNNFKAYSQYYEALYKDKDYDKEADYVMQLIKSFNPEGLKIIELGCGTGKHAEIFCRSGFTVTGLEQSHDMVAIANAKQILGFQPLEADIATYNLNEKFDVALSLFHVISYLNSNEKLISCLETTGKHLVKGGIFVFDVWYTPAVYYQQPETRIKRLSANNLEITRLAEPVLNYNKNVVEVHYEVIVKDVSTGKTDTLTEKHPMRHFSWPEIELLALHTGFKVVRAEEFCTGKQPGKETWGVCFILQKI